MKVYMDVKAKEYIKSVKRQLPVPGKMAKNLLGDLTNSVEEYTQSNKGVSMGQLVERFGEPKTIATEYILSLDEDRLKEEIRKSKFIKRTVLVIAIALVAVVSVTLGIIICRNETSVPHYVYEQVIN